MKIFNVVIVTLAGIVVAAPAPTPAPAPASEASADTEGRDTGITLDKRARYTVYITQHINWNGIAQNLGLNTGECHSLGNGWPRIVSSFGPSAGVTCTIYDNSRCRGSAYGGIRYPGIANLRTIGWNDRIMSLRCT
ncbi:hypothetical protein MFIFM68171_02952 [Madurella fahalii]|uniref:Beta/gamma crystallin 'Greek key' domain-containing protein n=1 Tax=Madurella fahalii TaxID=1157608 RepID=A0ABQ0G4P9_9PEZI